MGMRNRIALAGMLCALALSLGAGAAQEKQEEPEMNLDVTAMVGGWGAAEDFSMDEEKEHLKKALEDYGKAEGKTYEPVAYLGSQVVAGMNHAILCREEKEKGYASWVIVYLYEDLEGKVSVTNLAPLNLGELCTYGQEP